MLVSCARLKISVTFSCRFFRQEKVFPYILVTPVLLWRRHKCLWYLQNYHLWFSFSLPLDLNRHCDLFLEFLSKYFAIFIITLNITTFIRKSRKGFVNITTNRLNQTNVIVLLEKLHAVHKRVCSLRLHYGKKFTLICNCPHKLDY